MSAAAKTFQSNVIYSLSQTETYALALLNGDKAETAARQHGSTATRQHGSTAARFKRQQLLERPEPPTLHVVLDETVLWRNVGGTKVMHDQLMHLAEISPRDIKIRVLPNHATPGMHAPFVLARFGRR
jgi:hypothetical protein